MVVSVSHILLTSLARFETPKTQLITMKFTAIIVGLATVCAIASPVERRQNDVAKCENGSGTKENDTWDYASGTCPVIRSREQETDDFCR